MTPKMENPFEAHIERLKVQHEEMLLKHAREQNIVLSTLETALEQIERHKDLLTRAADALENSPLHDISLIDELRKAAE